MAALAQVLVFFVLQLLRHEREQKGIDQVEGEVILDGGRESKTKK